MLAISKTFTVKMKSLNVNLSFSTKFEELEHMHILCQTIVCSFLSCSFFLNASVIRMIRGTHWRENEHSMKGINCSETTIAW